MKSTVKYSGKKQYGGTLLGLIIGLVVGLAIAVVVALMITKTSTPFTNKLGMSKNIDTPAIQLTDPNKPLYGSAVREALANKPALDNSHDNELANATVGETTPETALLPEAVKLSSKPDARIETKTEPKSFKSLDSVIAKTDVVEKSTYYLQVGAFRDVSDAENSRAKLALLGVESNISAKNSEGDNLFRVRIGPFGQLDAMNHMRSKLAENSIDVAVIKTPK